MSETPQSEPKILSSEASPGSFLRQEREQQGLSREEVSAALNLRPAVIEGLEADVYDQIPVVTYRRGYLRSYAQLLGVDARQVMELYEARMGNEEVERKVTPVYLGKPPSRIGVWLFRLMTLVVIVGLVGLTLMWWQSRGGSQPPQVSDNSPVSVDSINGSDLTEGGDDDALPPVPADNSEMGLVAEDLASSPAASTDAAATPDAASDDRAGAETDTTAGIDSTPDTDATPAADSVAATDNAANNAAATVDAATADDASSTVAASATQQTADTAAAETPQASEQASSDPVLSITFNGASWVNINDSTNTQLLNGTQAADTTATLSGVPPIRLVIGNASEVEMNWKGDPIDLRRIAGRNNVARFTLRE